MISVNLSFMGKGIYVFKLCFLIRFMGDLLLLCNLMRYLKLVMINFVVYDLNIK